MDPEVQPEAQPTAESGKTIGREELSQAERVERTEVALAGDEQTRESGQLDETLQSKGLQLRVENNPDGSASVVGTLRNGEEVKVDAEPLDAGKAVLDESLRTEVDEDAALQSPELSFDDLEAALVTLQGIEDRTKVALDEAKTVAETLGAHGVAARRIQREGGHTLYLVSEDGLEKAMGQLQGDGFEVEKDDDTGFKVRKGDWQVELLRAAA